MSQEYKDNIGKCCLCGSECNPSSQTCGACPRAMTSYEFGWGGLPEHLKHLYRSKSEIEKINNSFIQVLYMDVYFGFNPVNDDMTVYISHYKMNTLPVYIYNLILSNIATGKRNIHIDYGMYFHARPGQDEERALEDFTS